MANFLSSAIHIIEEKAQVRSLAQPATAIPGIVGLTERGPLDTPTTVTSWEDYNQTFGGLYSGAEVPMCVRMFFLNGGGSAVIVRVLGEPYASITSGNAETYSFTDGMTLLVKVDGGAEQTATFNTADFILITAATAAEVAAVINTDITGVTATDASGYVQIDSDSTDTDARIEVTGGTGNTALGFSTTAVGITAFIDLEDEDATPEDTLRVSAKYAGAWGNNLSVAIEAATNGVAANFNMIILKNSVIEEVWSNLSMDDTAANFVETVVNDATTGSLYVTVTDLDSSSTPPDDRPADASATALTGGGDGSAVTDDTFTGGAVSTSGLNTLEESEITLLAIPDRATDSCQEAMITFCETTRERRVFAVMDPAAAASASTIVTNMQALTGSEQFALYWPRIVVPNPDSSIFTGDTITIPPSGAVMGMYARTDSNSRKGPFETPAGVERGVLYGVTDVETTTVNRKSTRDVVYPERINPITSSPSGYGVFVDGSRTGLGTGNFPSVGERRGVSHLENVFYSGLQYARHSNNTPALRSSLEKTVKGELLTWCEAGAFASGDPALAFMVDADIPGVGLNNARIRAQNKVYVRIGVATARPADYVILLVSQDTRAYTESLS